jgi:hypothetical protein
MPLCKEFSAASLTPETEFPTFRRVRPTKFAGCPSSSAMDPITETSISIAPCASWPGCVQSTEET